MESERKNSALRRGGSLNRLGSSSRLSGTTFVSRQRQLLEGHKIEGGEVKKTAFATDNDQSNLRKTKKLPGQANSVEGVKESPRTAAVGERLKEIGKDNPEAKREVDKFEQWYKKNYDENEVSDKGPTTREAVRKIPVAKRGVLVRSRATDREHASGDQNNITRQLSKDRLVTKSNSPRTLLSGSTGRSRQCNRPASSQAQFRHSSVEGGERQDINNHSSVGDDSLKLSLQGLGDDSDDEDIDLYEDEIVDEVKSPRKISSPRKGILTSTKSFEAKSSLIRRRDSDTSLSKPKSVSERTSSVDRVASGVKHSVSVRINVKEERTDGKQVALRRTSSGRKLPIPNEKLLRNEHLKKSESANSFLSISKDGNTEYVSLDLPGAFADHNSLLLEADGINFTCTAEMNTENRIRQRNEAKKLVSKNGVEGTGAVAGTENGVKSSPGGDTSSKPPLEKKPTRGIITGAQPSPRKIIAASPRTTAAAAAKVGTSPRVSNSPRMGTRAPSPRTVQVALNRGSPRERVTTPRADRATTPRTERATTPRIERATTPRSSMERRASRENLKSIDIVDGNKSKRNSTSEGALTNGSHTIDAALLRRRNSSGGSSIVSPRPSSPIKGSRLLTSDSTIQGSRIEEEPVRPRVMHYESCSNMDLQQLIAMFQVRVEESHLKVILI